MNKVQSQHDDTEQPPLGKSAPGGLRHAWAAASEDTKVGERQRKQSGRRGSTTPV